MAISSSFRTARWIRTINLVLQAVLFLSLFAMLNYVALHFALRFDLTRLRAHSLSAETRAHLKALNQPVRIYVTVPPSDQDVYQRIQGLLREFAYTTESKPTGRVTVEFIDFNRNPKKLRDLGIDLEQHADTISLVESGEPPQRKRRVITKSEVFRKDRRDLQDANTEFQSFTGEQAYTAAILDVTGSERKKIYFTVSHGEMELSNAHPWRGLSELRDQLYARNYDLETLNFATARKIPDDAALLVTVGPQSAFTDFELELLREYMTERNGHFLYLANDRPGDDTGLDQLWYDWGILVDKAFICDADPRNVTTNGDLVFRAANGEHPVTRLLPLSSLEVVFGHATVVRQNPSRARDEGLIVSRLIGSVSPDAWGERNLRDSAVRYTQGEDLPADEKLLVAAIASERVSAKKNLPFSVHGGRMVVFGSSDFVVNSRIGLVGNETLILSAINWLVERDAVVNVPARPIQLFQLSLTEQEQNRFQYCLLFGLPGAIGLLGLIVYWTRRR